MSRAVLHADSSSPHAGRIEFGQTRRWQRGWAGTATIDYDGDTWPIDLDMIEPYLADMIRFIEDIARPDWRGPAQWDSEYNELSIKADAESVDQITLAFSIWWSRGDELDNERDGELVVNRGELPRFAAQLRELTGRHPDAG